PLFPFNRQSATVPRAIEGRAFDATGTFLGPQTPLAAAADPPFESFGSPVLVFNPADNTRTVVYSHDVLALQNNLITPQAFGVESIQQAGNGAPASSAFHILDLGASTQAHIRSIAIRAANEFEAAVLTGDYSGGP